MNLKAHIQSELWSAVENSYEAGNYSHSIKDAMTFVTNILRDKSGLDGDGYKLVGKALGFSQGSRPKIQVNKLETETERDIQIGLREVLSGMYTLIRNPRTHERVEDDEETAYSIIIFINYLLDHLGESRPSFTIEDFIKQVKDEYFVEDKEYANELVELIPVRKRGDTLIALYRNATWSHQTKYKLTIEALISEVTESDIDHLHNVVSRKLEEANDSASVSLTRSLLPSEYWPKIEKRARLRAENILVGDLNGAKYFPEGHRTNSSPGTWINGILPYFSLLEPLRENILKLLADDDFNSHNYVVQFFSSNLPVIFNLPALRRKCIRAYALCIKNGNKFTKDNLLMELITYPEEWQDGFVKALKDLTDEESPEYFFQDGTPFLGHFIEKENPVNLREDVEDDIPF